MNDSKFWRRLEKICCNYTPVMITVCFVSAMLLMYIVDTRYNIEFNADIRKEAHLFYGITASLWKKILLLLIAGLSALPYALTRREKYTAYHFENWVKLGLVLGIAICFYSAVSVMDDIYDFLVMSLEGADFDVFRYGRPSYINYTQRNRLLLTSPQNTLLPLSICMLLHFLAEKQRNNRVAIIVCILLTLLGIRYLNPRIWYLFVILRSVAYLCLALVLGCISSMHRKAEMYGEAKSIESGWRGLLIIGIIVLALCGNIVLKMFMASWGFLNLSYPLSLYDVTIIGTLAVILAIGLLYAKRKKKLKSSSFQTILKLFPLLLLVLFCLIVDGYFSSEVIFKGKYYEMLKGLVDFLRDRNHDIWDEYSYSFGTRIWFFDCIACLIYVLYVLYDYGMKEHPKLYLGITMFLIIMAYIPNFTIPIGSGIESVSLVNILFGLLSPVLIISFGIINRRKTRELRN